MRVATIILVVCSVGVGCDKRPSPGGASSPSASGAPVPAEAPSGDRPQATAPRTAPVDIDLAALVKRVGCKGGKEKKACGVLAEFGEAGPWVSDTPSGEERWFGQAYVIEKGTERAEYVSLVSRKVPTARVGPGDLALMVSMAPIPEEHQMEAAKLWRTMSQGTRHRGSKKNLAFRYVESYVPTGERGAINTSGRSVQLITELSEDMAYLRQPNRKRLLVIRPASKVDADPGDGTYAELWQGTW